MSKTVEGKTITLRNGDSVSMTTRPVKDIECAECWGFVFRRKDGISQTLALSTEAVAAIIALAELSITDADVEAATL